jgi:Flp pilus assembly protein TadG
MTVRERKQCRTGAVMVEAAMCLPIFILCLFSIFEYGRLVMVRQLIDNAAREGTRYLVAHNTESGLTANIRRLVHQKMGGQDNANTFAGPPAYTVDGQPCYVTATIQVVNAAGEVLDSPTIDQVQPGEPCAVLVSGTFKTMFPTLLFLPVQIPLSSRVIMTCEGT